MRYRNYFICPWGDLSTGCIVHNHSYSSSWSCRRSADLVRFFLPCAASLWHVYISLYPRAAPEVIVAHYSSDSGLRCHIRTCCVCCPLQPIRRLSNCNVVALVDLSSGVQCPNVVACEHDGNVSQIPPFQVIVCFFCCCYEVTRQIDE